MGISPNSKLWKLVREVEDRQALLVDIEGQRQRVEHLALYEAGYDDIYDAVVEMAVGLKKLKLSLKRLRDVAEATTKKHKS